LKEQKLLPPPFICTSPSSESPVEVDAAETGGEYRQLKTSVGDSLVHCSKAAPIPICPNLYL